MWYKSWGAASGNALALPLDMNVNLFHSVSQNGR